MPYALTPYTSCLAPTAGSADETLRLWNLAVLLVAEDSGETNVNEREEAPKSNGGGARAHAVPMRKISVELKSYGGSIKCCSFNATGTLLCSGSGDNLVRVWRIRDRSCLHTLKGHKNWVLTLACSPLDECQFATGSSDGTVRVWNLNTASSSPSQSASATVLKPSKQPGGGVSLGGGKEVTAVAYHPLGNLLHLVHVAQGLECGRDSGTEITGDGAVLRERALAIASRLHGAVTLDGGGFGGAWAAGQQLAKFFQGQQARLGTRRSPGGRSGAPRC